MVSTSPQSLADEILVLLDKMKNYQIESVFRHYTAYQIFKVLVKYGNLIRSEILEKYEEEYHNPLPWTTAFDQLRILLGRGLIFNFSNPVTHKGRPETFYKAKVSLLLKEGLLNQISEGD